jgi:hypothetical protein
MLESGNNAPITIMICRGTTCRAQKHDVPRGEWIYVFPPFPAATHPTLRGVAAEEKTLGGGNNNNNFFLSTTTTILDTQ